MNNFDSWSGIGINNLSKYLPAEIKTVLQIGVFTGDITDWIIKNRDIDFIDDVDIWEDLYQDGSQGYNKYLFKDVESHYDSRFANNKKVNKHKMTSDLFFANKPIEELYDLVYIDGSHTSTQTILDSVNGFRLLKVGGIIIFDDYTWHYEEDTWLRPKRAIDAFLSLTDDRVSIIHMGDQVWVKKIK